MGNDGNTEDTTTKQSPPRKMLKIEKAVNRCITDLVTLNQLTINNDLVTLKKELTLSDDQVKYLKDYLLEKFVPVQSVKQALQRKEEDVEELVEELVEEKEVLIRKHEDALNHLVFIENFARKVACPTRLRYSIETFSRNFVFSTDDMNRRISDLNTKMVAALDSSRTVANLVNIVRQFASLTSKSEDDQNSKFPAVWKRLKSQLPKLIKPQNPTDLQKIIIELYEAANESIAKQTWLNNVEVWKTKLGELTFEDLTTVKDLASIREEDIREKIEQGDFDKIFKNEYEKEYVLDLLKLRKIGTDLPSMYKICFWILHVSVDEEVEKIRKKISGEWPGEIRAVRYDYYCTKVVELYNLVSELSKHGPGLIPPLNCKPTITDFHEYLKQLSSIGGRSLAFVAETLYVNEK